MRCKNLRLILGLGLVRVSSRFRVRISVDVRVSVMVRVSIRTHYSLVPKTEILFIGRPFVKRIPYAISDRCQI